MTQVKTMKVSGNDYAPVDERIRAFHTANGNGAIQTEIKLHQDKLIEARATVIPDVKNPTRYFTGSAVGVLGKEKALEKLETVAVGRALAFAGFLADGRIASAEEMQRFEENSAVTEPEHVTFDELTALNEYGETMYAGAWTDKRKELVKHVTKGRTEQAKELYADECAYIISGIKKKLEGTK